jgi:hypothetical protein
LFLLFFPAAFLMMGDMVYYTYYMPREREKATVEVVEDAGAAGRILAFLLADFGFRSRNYTATCRSTALRVRL